LQWQVLRRDGKAKANTADHANEYIYVRWQNDDQSWGHESRVAISNLTSATLGLQLESYEDGRPAPSTLGHMPTILQQKRVEQLEAKEQERARLEAKRAQVYEDKQKKRADAAQARVAKEAARLAVLEAKRASRAGRLDHTGTEQNAHRAEQLQYTGNRKLLKPRYLDRMFEMAKSNPMPYEFDTISDRIVRRPRKPAADADTLSSDSDDDAPLIPLNADTAVTDDLPDLNPENSDDSDDDMPEGVEGSDSDDDDLPDISTAPPKVVPKAPCGIPFIDGISETIEIGSNGESLASPIDLSFTKAELAEYYRLGRTGNVTCFTKAEGSSPINFFEQRVRCCHCGSDRFVTSSNGICCAKGRLILGGKAFPEPLADLMSTGNGISVCSRALNDRFRFAQMGLPKGTHRHHEAGGHFKVTGIPYAIIDTIANTNSSTRSFFDDPEDRLFHVGRVDLLTRPSSGAIAIVLSCLEQSPLARSLINWGDEEHPTAHLALKWPGTTTSVRAFTVNPATSVIGPRSVFFTRLDCDDKCYVRTDDPLYAPLMWPLAFPHGDPLVHRGTDLHVDAIDRQEKSLNMRRSTVAFMMQPARSEDGECILLPTPSPYVDGTMVMRRFSVLEKMGRLGDEIMIDRHLAVQDKRLRFLQTAAMQQKMVGHLETDDDVADQTAGTYLPPTEVGSPRYMNDRCSDALAANRMLGKAIMFITMTTSLKEWPEVWSRLPDFNSTPQNAFDRASLHAEAFEHKLLALLARLRTGTIFRNLGRPQKIVTADGITTVIYGMATEGGGYIMGSIEYQSRGLVHAHIAIRPANLAVLDDVCHQVTPNSKCDTNGQAGDELPWVDALVCARIPDLAMLREFKMIMPRGDARRMDFITHTDGAVFPQYAYLDQPAETITVSEDDEVVHPDIAADFGEIYTGAGGIARLLIRVLELTTGDAATTLPGGELTHWSLGACGTRKGLMIHNHPKGPDVCPPHCVRQGSKNKKCKSYFPKDTCDTTKVDDNGRVQYRRRACDVMVVPFNPWISLYFMSHINVEVVCSAVQVISYLFKYILKGSDTNRIQLIPAGAAQQGSQGSTDNSTHRRDVRPDEISEWRNATETCAPLAYRRCCGHLNYIQEPSVESIVIHTQRTREDDNDTGLSDFEIYMARPLLSSLDNMTVDAFYMKWMTGTELLQDAYGTVVKKGTAPAIGRLPTPEESDQVPTLAYFSKSGRQVYRGVDPTTLRLNSSTVLPPRLYWKRADDDPKLTRLKRVPFGSGQNYYLRLLATKIGARSYEGFSTHNNVTHDGYEQVCRVRGLLNEDKEARAVLEIAIAANDETDALRTLFVQLTIEGCPMTEIITDATVFDAIVGGSPLQNCLTDLNDRLQLLGKCMSDFFPSQYCPEEVQTELAREKFQYRDVRAQRTLCEELPLDGHASAGVPEQTDVVLWCLTGKQPAKRAASALQYQTRDSRNYELKLAQCIAPVGVEVAFLQGDGGAGKSRTVRRAIAELRSRSKIVLVSAATNLAATNFERSMSTHALAMLGIDGDEDGNTTVKLRREGGTLTPERLALWKASTLIIIDEGVNLKKTIIEAIINALENYRCNIRLLIVGDVQQIPPIAGRNSSAEETIEASLVHSLCFRDMTKLLLTKQYRAAKDEEWADEVRRIGDGSSPPVKDHPFNDVTASRRAVAMPLVENLFRSEKAAVEWVFGRNSLGRLNVGAGFKAILCAKNVSRNAWNQKVNEMREAESGDRGQTYDAYHEMVVGQGTDDADADLHRSPTSTLSDSDMAMFQNADHGVPIASLTLHVGDVCLLSKNIDKSAGLVKNQRVEVVELRQCSVRVKLSRDGGRSSLHTIGRGRFQIKLGFDGSLSLMRKQVPLTHAWALT
jgi:hypothetical protein